MPILCIACSDTGIASNGRPCVPCVNRKYRLLAEQPPVDRLVKVEHVTFEPPLPIQSIVRHSDGRFGLVMGHVRGGYDIAVVVDGEHKGNENWFRRNFDVVRKGS